MFKRRKQLQPQDHVREAVWPKMGWRRSQAYRRQRMGRLPGTPTGIATGFAFGAAISFTPFIGLHIVLAGLMSWACKGSILAAAIGTVVGNPWTFPLIWVLIYKTGILMLGMDPVCFSAETLTLDHLFSNVWNILLPMLVGSIPWFIVSWLAFFYPLRAMIEKYQMARRKRLAKKAGRAAE